MEPCESTRLTTGGNIWVCKRNEHPEDDHHYFIRPEPDERRPADHRLESDLEEFFRKRVKMLGGESVKMQAVQSGTPDRLVMMPGGHIFLVELKQNDGIVSPIQKQWHARARALGVEVYTVYGREGVLRWLRLVVNALAPDSTEAEPAN